MNVFIKSLFVGIGVIFLSSCASISPEKLGISQAQWSQYTPEQREQLAAQYKQTQEMQKSQSAKGGNSALQVNVEKGTALLPPFSGSQPYRPLSFQIREGECGLKIPVMSVANTKQAADMTACYTDSTLYLDASPYEADKAYGSIQFKWMPIWKRGFIYPDVNSTGLVKFKDVDVAVKEISR